MKKVFAVIALLLISCNLNRAQEIKIATYNIYFLDDGISQARKSHLQTVIKKLDADIIGFQEINNPAALKNILPANYGIAMLDDADEVQEVALAVRKPLTIQSVQYVFPEPMYDDAFPRARDLLEVTINGYNREFVVLVHHAKSRRGGRLATDNKRVAASTLILEHIKSDMPNKNIILLGDFNDNPDDRSLNILEYGDKNAPGGIDTSEDSFLFNTTEQLLVKNYCSYGYNYIYDKLSDYTFNLMVGGAREENNKWRGKKHNFYRDVKVKAILFDQILVSTNLKHYVKKTGVFNELVAVKGEASRIKFVDGKLQYTKRGSLASDHVPVWTILNYNK